MDKQEIETAVLKVLTIVLKCPVSLNSCRKDHHQWDSLKHIEVVFAIEDELNVQFPEEVLSSLDSVERIVASAMALRHEA